MPPRPPRDPRRFAALIPVKPPSIAKSRLRPLGDLVRGELAAALAVDTTRAALACGAVERVLVITDDVALGGRLCSLGAHALPDATTDDLNVTLVQAAAEARRRWPGLGLVALCADLPALKPGELQAALDGSADSPAPGSDTAESRGTGAGARFVTDAARTGTTAFIAGGIDSFTPRFGPDSRLRHLDAGATEIASRPGWEGLSGLRHDVDCPRDLAAVRSLGVGAATQAVLARHRL
jgi:2-phospho-L-lactate guanylyltransferase